MLLSNYSSQFSTFLQMSRPTIASARAHSNIAFIKYWGNQDDALRLPANSSLSMNLAALHSTTTVEWSSVFAEDSLHINGEPAAPAASQRASQHLHQLRARLKTDMRARVESRNNFPMGTGIASSASAFAALTLAAVAALDLRLPERELSALTRLGSGSAARSIPAGFTLWQAGNSHETSYAETFAAAEHWDLVDVIAIVSRAHKRVGSSAGHSSAPTSILQSARVENAPRRLAAIKAALLRRDFAAFARIAEEDSNLMHAVMMTSWPPLFYWQPLSLAIMAAVRRWRAAGLPVCYTLDAGPNVHCICPAAEAEAVERRLRALSPDIEILTSAVGGGARLMP